MNEPHPTRQKPARATALVLIGIALMGALAAIPTATAVGTPKDPCYADYISYVIRGDNTCGSCHYGEDHRWSIGPFGADVGPVAGVGPVRVVVPIMIWWNQCTNKPGASGDAEAVAEALPAPTGG